MPWVRVLTGLMIVCLAAAPGRSAEPERVQFNRDIRPILSDKCFFCHGPDANKREADLRLDLRDNAVDAGAINVDDPGVSELLRRITSTDPDVQMPPPASKLEPLSADQIATLRKWIEQGAEYEGHWAFIALQDAEPGIDTTSAVDRSVAAGLASRKLAFQPEADRATLIRRLSFDITGLPPSPADVEAFLADTSPDAYAKLVDRLLAAPQYGERMAVDWLDVSRYSDSFGFQVDRDREMWPWRDWVVRAFNQNLPFDQFITWQIAGDLLPDATDDQILATAFNRLHQMEAEGGSVEEEYRVEYVCDRVQTFATAFLGLTFECARCHDHKFDPIKQSEYYQLFAMFQNIDEAGLYSYFTPSPPTPALLLADKPKKEQLAELQAKIDVLESQQASLREARRDAFRTWLEAQCSTASTATPNTEATPAPANIAGELARYSFEALEGDKLANSIDAAQPATLKGENKLVPGPVGNAVEFTGDDPVDLTLGNFGRHEPFSVALWLRTPELPARSVVFHRSQAWTDAASRGYELLIEDGRLKWSLIHFWPGNAISIRATEPLTVNEWTHVVVTYDGSSRSAGLKLFVNGRPVAVDIMKDNLTKEITGGGHDHISLAERMRDRGFKGGAVDEFRIFGRALSPLEVEAAHQGLPSTEVTAARIAAESSPAPDNELFDFYLATVDPEWSKHLDELKAARLAHHTVGDAVAELMVMRELPEPKKAYILFRGEYAQRREEVTAGTPEALSPFPDGAPRNRLGLARWLTDRRHPLTSRVTVNRVWQSLFGRGLVKTSEDFGSQGAKPLYPDVLDALAIRFIDSGWDMKQLLRSIVMSQTYRQQSIADEQTMADDPDNEWLARGPRFRLPAEMIRDNALAAAGLLNLQSGGAPANPYEMSEAFRPSDPSAGDGVYRRSLYTTWRRTSPPPAMLAFDAPRRAVCIAKRERTDTPLQALILLNGVQYVEAARVLGESLHRDSKGDVAKMIDAGFVRCLSRPPDALESEILTQLYHEQREHFTQHPTEAESFLKIGTAVHDTAIPTAEAAAATILAQALLNHDACVVKR